METEIIEKLYHSEINYEICTFFDEGYVINLGDKFNGFKASYSADNFKEAINGLAVLAAREYPRSEFAKWWSERNGN